MSVFALAFDFEFPSSNSSFLILIPFKSDGEHLEYFNMPTVRSSKIYLKISKSTISKCNDKEITKLEFETSYQFTEKNLFSVLLKLDLSGIPFS